MTVTEQRRSQLLLGCSLKNKVSDWVNVSVNTLRYWRQTGDGPEYVKFGKLVRYDLRALELYIRRNLRVSKRRATTEETHVAH
jgi:hypothetical protein